MSPTIDNELSDVVKRILFPNGPPLPTECQDCGEANPLACEVCDTLVCFGCGYRYGGEWLCFDCRKPKWGEERGSRCGAECGDCGACS